MLAGVCVLAIVTLAVTLMDTGPPQLPAGSDLVLPLAKLKANQPSLFRYHIDASTLAPVVVQKAADGSIGAAFGACRPCFKSGSYEWSGKLMCGHCRHVMKMADAKTEPSAKKSSCALPRLDYTFQGDRVVVREATILSEFSRQYSIRQ
jgi:uncharacterized membrane protein